MNYRSSTDFLNGAVTRVLLLFDRPSYIKDIYFLEVNTKYISSSVLKTSEFSRLRSTSENSDVFNPQDEIYLVFTEKK